MQYYLVAKVNGRTVIFGMGNTPSTAKVADGWNAREMGVEGTKVVHGEPPCARWFDSTPEYAQWCEKEDAKRNA